MEGDCEMKNLLKAGLIGAFLFSGFAATSTETLAATQPEEETMVTTQPEEETNLDTYGAGVWDLLGDWKAKTLIRVTLGGGDAKICLPDLSSKVNISLDSYTTFQKDLTTDGVGENCAVFRSIGGPGGYDIFFTDGPRATATTIRVYD